MNLKVTVR